MAWCEGIGRFTLNGDKIGAASCPVCNWRGLLHVKLQFNTGRTAGRIAYHEKHIHRWIISRGGIGQCACGESRQFETRVNLDLVATASMHPQDWREWQGNYREALKLSPVYIQR